MMKKVRVAAVILLLSATACREASEVQETDDPNRFGSAYEIVTNERQALPDEPPALMGDTLSAQVAYPGGCTDHDFELHTEVRLDTARLWLRHSDYGDDCEGMINDRIEIDVPEDVLDARTILLLNPNAPEPFVLRWGDVSEP